MKFLIFFVENLKVKECKSKIFLEMVWVNDTPVKIIRELGSYVSLKTPKNLQAVYEHFSQK